MLTIPYRCAHKGDEVRCQMHIAAGQSRIWCTASMMPGSTISSLLARRCIRRGGMATTCMELDPGISAGPAGVYPALRTGADSAYQKRVLRLNWLKGPMK